MRHKLQREITNDGKQRGGAQAWQNAAEYYTRDHLRPVELRKN